MTEPREPHWTPTTWHLAWAMVVLLTTSVLIGASNIVYTNHERHQSEQQWCELLRSLDQPENPASSDRGREIQRQIHELRIAKGC